MPYTERSPMRQSAASPGLGHCAPEWLQAVAGDAQQPCGVNLECDNDYAVLQVHGHLRDAAASPDKVQADAVVRMSH